MEYFLILGNNPTLSLAEISAVLPLKIDSKLIQNKVFLFKYPQKIDVKALIKNMGGIIKIGIINNKLKNNDLFNSIKEMLGPKEGKYKFGFSYYGQKKLNIKPLAMNIKKHLKEKDVNSRWITSKEPTLSSVVVEQNKLTTKGLEIIIISDDNNFYLGKTLAVQPFKELSYRDYGRPARDDKSGMLPPKLAQIMINLSLTGKQNFTSTPDKLTILDPFCGSGTILTEAFLMEYNNLIGSDISKKAVADTKKNIEWINNKFKNPSGPVGAEKIKIFQLDVLNLSKKIKKDSIDAIVTEPYLGPQRGRIDIKKIIPELEILYSNALFEFKKVLKNNGRIVMVFPIFNLNRGKQAEMINPDLQGLKIINPIPVKLRGNKNIKLTNRETIIYGREGQKVWREIVVLEKI